MRILKHLVCLLAVFAVTGCYMPIRFDAEIDINRAGYYQFFFDGYLAKVQLYQDLQDRKISRDEELEQVALIKADFERDSATEIFQYY